MPEAVVDLAAGILRLPRSQLMGLASIAATGRFDAVEEEDIRSLKDAGLVRDGVANPEVELLARTVYQPVANLRLDLATTDRRVSGTGWIGPELTVLAVPAGDGLDEIKACPTGFLPGRLAGYLDLGPRPRRSGSAVVARKAIDALEPGVADQVLAPGDEIRLRWRVTVAWRQGQSSLEILDAGQSGLWQVGDGDEEARIYPTTPTAVWMGLASLLPRAEELADV